jgi:hypothetical protein
MSRWRRRTFALILIRQRSPDARPMSLAEKLTAGAVYVGLAILAAGGVYDIRNYRSSPHEPDATHTVLEEEHGDRRYKTPEQIRRYRQICLAGGSLFFAGAAVLIVADQLDKRRRS